MRKSVAGSGATTDVVVSCSTLPELTLEAPNKPVSVEPVPTLPPSANVPPRLAFNAARASAFKVKVMNLLKSLVVYTKLPYVKPVIKAYPDAVAYIEIPIMAGGSPT